eukprot:5385130-Alexandrium_andersonii.AAC.1
MMATGASPLRKPVFLLDDWHFQGSSERPGHIEGQRVSYRVIWSDRPTGQSRFSPPERPCKAPQRASREVSGGVSWGG